MFSFQKFVLFALHGNLNVFHCAGESVAASFGRGRRSAPTNRSRQQLQREKALHMAAKQKAALGDSPLSPEQQLQPAPSPAPTPAPNQTHPDEVPKQEPQQAEAETVPSEDPGSAVKELDKQEVELLVSLMQRLFVVIRFPCMIVPDVISRLIKGRHY